MQIQPAPPAPSTPAVLSTPAQTATAKATPTPPAAPAHPVQAAPAANPPVPLPLAPGVTASEKAPRPATTPTVDDPMQDVTADATVDHNTPTPAPIDTEAEAELSAEIVELWAVQKNGEATARRTRVELKALRQQLGEKLHAMKAILVGTGRGGGWAPYLRSQRIPVASANRHVAEHDKKITQPAAKLLIEQHSEPTADDARKLATKLLPSLCRILVSQELVFEFVHEILWNMDVAEVTDTDLGLEIPRTSQEASVDVEDQAAELADPAQAAA